ncbi:MAG TPA: histidine kinase [Actinomycetota bacterium]|jgi:signal transduction histidine kinase|nr:histidine kinase [Actinomycetota bacterium]
MTISDQGLRRCTWAVAGLYLLGGVAAVWLDRLSGYQGDYFFAVILLAFPAVGFVVLQKRPRNTLGWLMLAMGIPAALPFQDYAEYALVKGLPGGAVGLALSEPTWVPFIGISGFLLLLFPDGHLPTPRWRWFGWTCGIGLGLLGLLVLFGPGTFGDIGHPEIRNPWGWHPLDALGGWIYVTTIFAPLVVVGGAVAVFRRLRRATDPVERQQLRWLAWAAVLIAGAYVFAFIPELVFGSEQSNWNDIFATLAVASFILIPITIGIAILRYRLYDIDVVIRKTVVFAVLAVFIAVVYVGIVAGISVVVGNLSSTVASAIAAAVVALAIQPVRGWAQRTADRIVYGRRATPYEVLTSFGENLAETYAADDVLQRLARVLGEGVGADRARVWLGPESTRRVVAEWPDDVTEASDDDLVEPVRHQGEVLGALSVSMPARDPIDEPRTELINGLAAQAGLVLRNVGLLEDLRESRRRLVAAQDLERRKLERNIHDGAQQQLVALTVKLRLARQVLAKDPSRVDGMLGELAGETQRALEDLRDLARGIYPPLLADQGLGAALEAQARRSPVPVAVETDGVGRYAPEVEAAVYFSCLEALQNVAKYAGATAATIQLAAAPDRLVFRIHDNGVGFDADATSYGTGLQGIADRLAALGGALVVASTPGGGTAITGSLPAREADAKVSPDGALPAVAAKAMGAARP